MRHVKDIESMFVRVFPKPVTKKVAYQYAEANEIDHPFSQEEKATGIGLAQRLYVSASEEFVTEKLLKQLLLPEPGDLIK